MCPSKWTICTECGLLTQSCRCSKDFAYRMSLTTRSPSKDTDQRVHQSHGEILLSIQRKALRLNINYMQTNLGLLSSFVYGLLSTCLMSRFGVVYTDVLCFLVSISDLRLLTFCNVSVLKWNHCGRHILRYDITLRLIFDKYLFNKHKENTCLVVWDLTNHHKHSTDENCISLFRFDQLTSRDFPYIHEKIWHIPYL